MTTSGITPSTETGQKPIDSEIQGIISHLEKNIKHYLRLFDRSNNPNNSFADIEKNWQIMLRFHMLVELCDWEEEVEDLLYVEDFVQNLRSKNEP